MNEKGRHWRNLRPRSRTVSRSQSRILNLGHVRVFRWTQTKADVARSAHLTGHFLRPAAVTAPPNSSLMARTSEASDMHELSRLGTNNIVGVRVSKLTSTKRDSRTLNMSDVRTLGDVHHLGHEGHRRPLQNTITNAPRIAEDNMKSRMRRVFE